MSLLVFRPRAQQQVPPDSPVDPLTVTLDLGVGQRETFRVVVGSVSRTDADAGSWARKAPRFRVAIWSRPVP